MPWKEGRERGTWYGPRESVWRGRRFPDNANKSYRQLVAQECTVANAVWHSMLRDRDDGNPRGSVRPFSLWGGSRSVLSETIRLAHRERPYLPEDDAGPHQDLPANAGAKVGDLNGCMRFMRGRI